MSDVSRRGFIAAAGGAAAVGSQALQAQQTSAQPMIGQPKAPVIICASNGYAYLDAAYEALKNGEDTLDAAIRVVRGPEEDPNDDGVGFGGLPNEEGVVELDSCCMHGPTHRAGSVGGLRNVMNASMVAKAVMEHTGHVMLVGEGAERFAYAMGFEKKNLLTERSRKIWMLWKENHSDQDWWGPGIGAPGWKPPLERKTASLEERVEVLWAKAERLGILPEDRADAIRKVLDPPRGTIHCSALNAKGEISGITTTSGLAWKLPGRCGDSPVIGAGCYTDPDIGSAGATGSGEENIKVAGAHTIVENMRHGMSPKEAGLDVLKRIVRFHNNDMNQLRYIGMTYYILRKDGEFAGVALWSGNAQSHSKFAVHDGKQRLEDCVALLQGASISWPPIVRPPA
ncbi:MAG: N(4)-(beta-N-acetylglucosaminyl)-L-asparaginase [Bryobacteraceae bacterium]|jgi:N4-(beta-N-acetylglucosaminyl)-L-asparaginase